MPGQAQDSVALHVPARNDYMAAVGGILAVTGLLRNLDMNRWKGSMSSGMIFTSV